MEAKLKFYKQKWISWKQIVCLLLLNSNPEVVQLSNSLFFLQGWMRNIIPGGFIYIGRERPDGNRELISCGLTCITTSYQCTLYTSIVYLDMLWTVRMYYDRHIKSPHLIWSKMLFLLLLYITTEVHKSCISTQYL